MNWKLEILPLKSLKEHDRNPRKIGKEQLDRLGKMIEKFGLIDKPIINQDMTIIGGHQRIKYLKKQKVKEVECWVADRLLSPEEIDELCIGLNLHQGQWDWEVLQENFDTIQLLDFGFAEEQLASQIKDAKSMLEDHKEKKKRCCPNCGHEF